MKSEWKVTSNSICGETYYAVYRILKTEEVDHSGNREYATEYMEDREQAKNIALKMNKEELFNDEFKS